MSNPRAIAQAREDASAVSGSGVTLTVDDASLFASGQVIECYPRSFRDDSPLNRARHTVRYVLTSAPVGNVLTGIMNYDSYADPPLVERGWIIDGRAQMSANVPDAEVVDGFLWAKTRAGVEAANNAAIANGKKKVILTAGAYTWDATNLSVITTEGFVIEGQGRGTVINLPATADSISVFRMGSAVTGASTPLTGATAQFATSIPIGAAAIASLGIVAGNLVHINNNKAGGAGNLRYEETVKVYGTSGNDVLLEEPLTVPYEITTSTLAKITTVTKNPVVRNLHINGNGNTGTSHGVVFAGTDGGVVEGITGDNVPGGLVYTHNNWGIKTQTNYSYRCGSISFAGIHHSYETKAVHKDETSEEAWGYGINNDAQAWAYIENPHSFRSGYVQSFEGRGVKFDQTRSSTIVNPVANDGYGTGIIISSGCHNNTFIGGEAYRNRHQGWYSTDGQDGNRLHAPMAGGNDVAGAGYADFYLLSEQAPTPGKNYVFAPVFTTLINTANWLFPDDTIDFGLGAFEQSVADGGFPGSKNFNQGLRITFPDAVSNEWGASMPVNLPNGGPANVVLVWETPFDPANTTLSGATLAGATSFGVASAVGFATGDFVVIDSDGKIEIKQITVAGTTFTVSALFYAHSSGAVVYKREDALFRVTVGQAGYGEASDAQNRLAQGAGGVAQYAHYTANARQVTRVALTTNLAKGPSTVNIQVGMIRGGGGDTLNAQDVYLRGVSISP